ncbi:CHRD domain-containing protein [Hymenobacter saemangeumensis]
MFTGLLRNLTAALLLAVPLAASADHLRPHLLFSARLTGDQETPPVTTAAQGVGGFTLNATRDTLFVQAAFTGLSGAITGVHIHEGAVGVAGPVVTNLLPMLRGNRLSGFLTGADIAPARLAKYLRGLHYLNVHTAANPGGEIRGQIRLETDLPLVASLTGAQEVPAVATTATGLGIFTLSQSLDKLKFRVALAGLSGPITGVHFHEAAVGVNGPVIVNLAPYLNGNVVEGEIVPSLALLNAISQGLVYINVHTASNPGGEIRSQLVADTRFVAHDAVLDGAQMVPANAATGKGLAVGRLVATLDTMTLFVAHAGLSGPPTSVALYAADAGQPNTSGNLLGTLAISSGAGGNTNGNITGFRLVNLAPATVNAFLRGTINLVINTAANPSGEIRGQLYRLAREGYTISLNGAQERPNPTSSPGYGVGVVSIDRDQRTAHFMSVWGGLSGPITGAHFHTGLSTQSGPVVFNLAPYFDTATNPSSVNGFWKDDNTSQPFTLRRSLQFRRDSMYMNLHTAAFPGGEIRGQVYRGARNLQRVLSTRSAALLPETVTAAPNPFTSVLTLAFESRQAGPARLQVSDLLGRSLQTQALAVRAGSNSVPLSLGSLAPGIYLLTVELADSRVVMRVVKE